MHFGKRDRQITIQFWTRVQDEYGQMDETWSTVYSKVWAALIADQGAERFVSSERQADRYVVFNIRWIPGLTAQHRILYEDRIYEVTEIVERGRRDALDIRARTSDRVEAGA